MLNTAKGQSNVKGHKDKCSANRKSTIIHSSDAMPYLIMARHEGSHSSPASNVLHDVSTGRVAQIVNDAGGALHQGSL